MTDFTGGRAILRDEASGETVASTPILGCNKQSQVIQVSASSVEHYDRVKLSLLILLDGLVYEFEGILRKSRGFPRADISLFHGKQKEGRATTRYDLNTTALAQTQEHTFPVTVLNISTVGALIQAGGGTLALDDDFDLVLYIDGNPTVLRARVVRVREEAEVPCQYGCRFFAVT